MAQLWTFPFYLNPGEAQTALGECFVCVNMCVKTSDTVDQEVGQGWESSVLSILFLPHRREPKGREKRGISKAEGKEGMLFTGVDRESLYLQVALRSLSSHWSGNWIQS